MEGSRRAWIDYLPIAKRREAGPVVTAGFVQVPERLSAGQGVSPSNWKNGRGERIRTSDPLVPNQVRYQTALRPE
jgi:hypothetical protein